MNKQSNVYTIIYIIVLVAVVGTGLAFTAMSLKGRQTQNAAADKMRQILASVHVAPESGESVIGLYEQYITESYVVDAEGARIDGDAFGVNVQAQSKLADPSARHLPVYVCRLADGSVKYILAAYGSGLWGPIWGYVAVDSDGSTIYGAYFSHESETPGLGAKIAEPAFYDQFDGKALVKDGRFVPVQVVKKGQKPTDGADYVDAISGATITSKGVGAMLDNCLQPYQTFLNNLTNR